MPKTPAVERLHVWAPVAFAHLRAYRCGVIVDVNAFGNTALCDQPPLYVAEMQPTLPSGRGPLTALCGQHGAAARSWPLVVSVQTLPDPATGRREPAHTVPPLGPVIDLGG